MIRKGEPDVDSFYGHQIVALDDAASGPSGEGALLRLALKLSQSAPSAWSDYFNEAWNNHFYMTKRRASAWGDRLEIICSPDELESDHLPELQKVVSEANAAYRNFAAEQERLSEGEAKAERRQREELSELKARLKFD